jgi:beta-lactamase class A
MRIHRLILLTILLCAIPAVSQQQKTSLELLLETEASPIPAKVGIYVKHLASGEEAAVHADDLFNSASTRKVPIMIMAVQQYEQGKLDLRERVTIQRSDFRGGTGVLQYHDPGDVLTLHDLLTEMIITSDNTATEIVMRKLGGPDVINKWLADQNSITRTTWGNIEGIRRMYRLFNPVYGSATDEELTALEYLRTDNPLFNEYQDLFKGPRQGLAQQITANSDLFADAIRRRSSDDRNYWTGTTSPRDMGRFLESIERAKAASLKGCLEMKHILLRQQLGARRIPHYLDMAVAHKTGDVVPGVANDVGLVYARSGPIVISFFTMGITGPYADTEDQIGKISRDIVDYFDKRSRG